MEYLPLFHNLKGRTVLIVGGGEIALRKARLLSDAGARLRVVAPSIEAQLVELVHGRWGMPGSRLRPAGSAGLCAGHRGDR